ncbi:hypothetical protein BEN42_02590 [Leptospira interrogans serovar Canicola]|nr:hypothetical protein [Leptospira interrogans serovar Canicola]OQN93301.1 hypothetical protein AR690_09430 [Leptospira interrogans serovar Lai]
MSHSLNSVTLLSTDRSVRLFDRYNRIIAFVLVILNSRNFKFKRRDSFYDSIQPPFQIFILFLTKGFKIENK